MALGSIVRAAIHPAIGVARIGNSADYVIGPEIPYPPGLPPGSYHDSQGRLKRQAQRFRIYGYDKRGNVVAELTHANAEIEWNVHVANKKAAWYDFDVALDLPESAGIRSARRNAQTPAGQRQDLIIDPGARTIAGKPDAQPVLFDTGKFLGRKVYLGELRTDRDGRLLFLGGRGKSGAPLPGFTLNTFANNPGWHDDTSDGPVSAIVTIRGRKIEVEPAWVVTAPPNYAPDIVAPQTMYDVVFDTMTQGIAKAPAQPSFTDHILPVLRQMTEYQWVNAGFLAQFGWQAPYDFMRPELLMKLSAAPGKPDLYQELRKRVFLMFRDPGARNLEPLKWPPLFGDAFGNFDNPPSPRVAFAITRTLYAMLKQWAGGTFTADYNAGARAPKSLATIPLLQQPSTLDRAALHFCMGGPFHPGCEMTWPMRQVSMYSGPFRIRHRPLTRPEADYGDFLTKETVMASDGPLSSSGPGDITKWMAVPWQSDTASCRAGYSGMEFPPDPVLPAFWPACVPNHVLTAAAFKIVTGPNHSLDKRRKAFYDRQNWLRSLGLCEPYFVQITKMVRQFGKLGVIEKRVVSRRNASFPSVMYVESKAPAAPKGCASPPSALDAIGFMQARFRQDASRK